MQSCTRRRELLCAVTHETSITDGAGGRISTEELKNPFVLLDRCPPFTKNIHQVIQYGCSEDYIACEDSAALRV